MTEYILPLSKVRCMNCAGKIQTSLRTLPGIDSVTVDTQQAIIHGDSALAPIIDTITELGYGAGYHHSLPLQGLSCGKCVAKLEQAFAENPNISRFTVTKTQADIDGLLTRDEAVALIEHTGYQVPAPKPLHLALSGLSCGKCVAKVEQALAGVTEVSAYEVSKTRADIATSGEAEAVISAIEQLGYQATPTSPPAIEITAETTQQAPETTPADAVVADTADDVPASPGKQSLQLMLSGMTCASCVASVEKAIRSVPGVTRASVNLAERTALVSGEAPVDRLIEAITDAGYGAELSEDEHSRRERQQTENAQLYRRHLRNSLIALGAGLPMMGWGIFGGSMMITSTASQLGWGAVGIVTFVMLYTIGRHFFVNAWKAFRHHRATMDTLVALGTGAAWLYSTVLVLLPELFPEQARHVYFEASVMILGLITLGHALEARARSRTSKALEQLIDLQPQTAILVTPDGEKEVALAEIHTGALLRLRPGAKVPVDGTIEEGQSYLDESMLTGEPLPANKQPGDKLHAGTINQNGSLLFRAEQIGSDTMLARIINLVSEAQNSKPALARLADTVSAIFVPSVMIIAIVTAMIWYYVGPAPSSIYMLVAATTVLIIACPCALGLATPMSVMVGVGRAAEYGVLIRNAEAMQLAANIDTVVVDKTGTLTEGKPQVTTIHAYDTDESQLLQLAASLERGSEHPLADAICQAASERSLALSVQSDFEALPGYGVAGNVEGQRVLLGNQKLMTQHQIDIAAAVKDVQTIAEQGATPIYIAIGDQLGGLLGVSDPLRSDSVAAIERLHQMGLNVVMLTGDTEITANAIARQAGIDTVIASVLPDGKAAKVAELQQQGKRVAMVGDGINDAPALAQAEVGIAMGSGSDVAIESAQLTLIRHSLHGVADALQLCGATLKNMKQNLFGAFIYNSLGIPVAAGILYPLTGTLLSPVIAGAAMALSSITVVSNANRLRLFKPDRNLHQ
ncbi:copper-translocating P-type ATPase [Photobacterium atrarenae]|uniref:Copper-exporting P-type ATPase n=1 Tax=Photobacterium atrarenae TaxID=865757 RepID=A0ABY5GGK5_9GAMM|nr:copper-translocating P-type ATPase [Photobacterium atrarenae]UTV28369.1 copper-translocating P-type ATPase [Photobacterium atrarenae]